MVLDAKSFYDKVYEDPDIPLRRRLAARGKVDSVIRLANHVPHDSIIEIGAGDGAMLVELAARGFGKSYRAIDVSQKAIDQLADRHIPGLLSASVFDGETIPYEDREFDLAMLNHVAEHLDNPRRMVREAARVAKNVVMQVPLEDTLWLGWDFKRSPGGHVNFYSPRSFRHLVQSCDLAVLEQITVNPSLAVHRHRAGLRGVVIFAVKDALGFMNSRMASRFGVYEAALLARAGD